MEYIAHLREDGAVQLLRDHLHNTAKLASGFAKPFDAEGRAEQAGLLHDMGKYAKTSQHHIRVKITMSRAWIPDPSSRDKQELLYLLTGMFLPSN